MNEDLKKLYDAVSGKFDVGTIDEFTAKMATPEQRKGFYDIVSSKGFDIGDYNSYEERLKKKDNWEPFSPDISKLSAPGSETVLKSELPLQSPEAESTPQEQPRTFSQWATDVTEPITSFTGELNKATATMMDELDWVQTTAGDALNQIIFGKEKMSQLRDLREKGLVLNPLTPSRPFEAAADLLRWTASGTKELPNTIGGQIASGVAHIAPEIAATLLLPEVKTSLWMSKLGMKTASKFGTVLGARGAVQGAEGATTPTESITAPMAGFAEGYVNGLLFDGFGSVSAAAGNKLATTIIPKVTSQSQALTQNVISQSGHVLANTLIFAGYGAGTELVQTGSTSWQTAAVNAGMGLALGTSGVGRAIFAKGVNTFLATPNEVVSKMAKVEITPEQLMEAGIEKANNVEAGKFVQNREADVAAAAMNINAASLKVVADEIKANPEKVKKNINDSTIPEELKGPIIDKINDFVAADDPKVQQAKPFTEKINEIDSQIESIKNNKSLSSVEREIQTDRLKAEREVLKIEVEKVYNVPAELRTEKAEEAKPVEKEPAETPKSPSTEPETSTISPETGKDATQGKKPKKEATENETEAFVKSDTGEDIKDYESLAVTAYQGESISIDPMELSPKFKKLKDALTKAKDEPKRMKQLFDGFLKENKQALKDANITSQILSKLNKAKTWTDYGKVIKELTTEMDNLTAKERVGSVAGYLKNNKTNLKGIPSRVTDKMIKLASQAYKGDIQMDRAVNYIDKVLANKAAADAENLRLKDIEGIKKITSDKAVLEKGGKRPIVKRSLLTRDGFTDRVDGIRAINDLINEGSSKISKEFEKPNETIEKNLLEIESIINAGYQTKEAYDRLLELQTQNEILDLANIDTMPHEQVKIMKDRVKELVENQRTKASIERSDRAEMLSNKSNVMLKNVLGAKTYAKWDSFQKAAQKRVYKHTKGFLNLWGDSSWFSLNSKLSAKGELGEKGKLPVFNDPINALFARDINRAEGTMEHLRTTFNTGRIDKIKELFGKKTQTGVKNALIDLSVPKDTGIQIVDTEGNVVKQLDINDRLVDNMHLSQMQAANLWLQWRDPYARKSLEKPIDPTKPLKEQGMGFTQETMDAIEKYLTPEAKQYAEWASEKIKALSNIYDEAYKKANGISFKINPDDPYHPVHKAPKFKLGQKEVIGDPKIPNQIASNRTLKRTGDDSPIEIRSLDRTLVEYMNEAVRYASWNSTLRDLRYVYKNPDVVKAIKMTHGERPVEIIDYFLDSFSGKNVEMENKAIDQMTQALGGGLLNARIRPAIKQMSSSLLYAIDMPLYKVGTGLFKHFFIRNNAINKATRGWIATQPFIESRRSIANQLGMDIDVAGVQVESGTNPIWKKAANTLHLSEIQDITGKALEIGDKTPIVGTGAEYLRHKYQMYAKKPLTEKVLQDAMNGNVDPNLRKATDDWEMISALTQQTLRESNRSKYRSTQLGRAMSMFTSQPAQMHRLSMSYMRDFEKAYKSGNYSVMRESALRFMLMWPLSGMIQELINQNFTVDSEEDVTRMFISALMGPISGVAYVGKVASHVADIAGGRYWADADRLQILTVVSQMEKISKHAASLERQLTAPVPDKDKIRQDAVKLVYTFASFAGIPAEGVGKIIDGGYETTEKLINNPDDMDINDLFTALGMEEDNRKTFSEITKRFSEKTYTRYVEDAMDMMAYNKDGVLEMDLDAMDGLSKVAIANGMDGAAIIKTAYFKEYMQKFYKEFGYMDTIDELIKALESGKASAKDADMIMDKIATKLEFNTDEEYINATEAIMDVMEKAAESGGVIPVE